MSYFLPVLNKIIRRTGRGILMRNKLSYLFFLLFLFCSVPYLLTVVLSGKEETKPVDFQTHSSGYTVTVNGKAMDLETYLLGVLPTQISMDEEKETLKAQAVILRTDIMRRMDGSKDVSQDSLPYKYEEDKNLKEKLGEQKYKITDQSRKQAVGETTGEVITCQGKYIQPYFHGISVGTTLSAKEWFGKDISYLQEKDSLKDVESPEYMTGIPVTYKQVVTQLEKEKKIKLTVEEAKKSIRIKEKTGNGYVKQVQIGKYVMSGEAWAKCFQLNSTNFYLEPYDGKLRMVALGKGLGLGMSQYGANELAKDGKSYKKILKYYYTGIQITKLSDQ